MHAQRGAEFGPDPHHQRLALRAFQPYCCSLSRFRTEVKKKNGPTSAPKHKLTGEAATHLSSFGEAGLDQGLQLLIGLGLEA